MTEKHKSNYVLHLHCINVLTQGCWESVLKTNQSWFWLFLYNLSAYQRWWIDFDDSDAGLLLSSLYQVIIVYIFCLEKIYFFFILSWHHSPHILICQCLIDSWFFNVTSMIISWFLPSRKKKNKKKKNPRVDTEKLHKDTFRLEIRCSFLAVNIISHGKNIIMDLAESLCCLKHLNHSWIFLRWYVFDQTWLYWIHTDFNI